jgi:hypothetical protein
LECHELYAHVDGAQSGEFDFKQEDSKWPQASASKKTAERQETVWREDATEPPASSSEMAPPLIGAGKAWTVPERWKSGGAAAEI